VAGFITLLANRTCKTESTAFPQIEFLLWKTSEEHFFFQRKANSYSNLSRVEKKQRKRQLSS